MSGVAWRRLALLAMLLVNMRLAASIVEWIPGAVGITVALVATAVFMLAFLLTPLRERPRCGWQRKRFERRFLLAVQLGDMTVMSDVGEVVSRWRGQRGWRRAWTLLRMWRWKWLP